MEENFASLSKRQSMLLLTSLAFGGSEAVAAFDFLTDEEGELLKHRAGKLLQIPRDKRIPLLVQEIKRLVTARRRQLASADPARLAEVLAKERPAMVEVVLRALPSNIAEAVRAELPPQRAPVKLKHDVRPDILSIIRWKLEDALKKAAPQVGAFKFSDVLTLQARDLLAVCDRMGARALATAFAGLEDAAREALFEKLPPDQRTLAQRATEAGRARKLTPEDSATVLKMFGADENPSAGLRSAGAQRLARACVAQSPEFASRMIERHANELGRLLQRWVKEERNRGTRGDGGRSDIVEQLERLAIRGVIDRPMRLPPPQLKPPAPAPPARRASQADAAQAPGGKVIAPPPRGRGPQPGEGPDRRSEVAVPVRGERPALPAPPGAQGRRRDIMAERAARQAGAASARLQERASGARGALPPRGEPPRAGPPPRLSPRVPPRDPRVRVEKEPSVSVRAPIVRDGKRLESVGDGKAAPPPAKGRAITSPALQEIPRRRDRPADGTQVQRPSRPGTGSRPSPVLKGGSRGPGEGSR